jgi:hypothetical protein
MGRSYTPKYVVRITMTLGRQDSQIWDSRHNGRPTAKNLSAWRDAMNRSFERGGVNEHVSAALGRVERYFNCAVVNQFTGATVAEFKAPMFEAV